LVRWRTMPTERPPLVDEVVPTFADRGCCVGSATDPPVVSLGFLDQSRYYFFEVAPQLSSRGWVDPVPGPLLLRKSGSAGNRTEDLWICRQKLWPLDHRGGRVAMYPTRNANPNLCSFPISPLHCTSTNTYLFYFIRWISLNDIPSIYSKYDLQQSSCYLSRQSFSCLY
jgi:hypothetical protein